MRSYTRARLLGATALAVAVLVAMAPVASAAAPPKFQVTVTDDFSSGSIQFVVATVPEVVPADTYKVGLANNSIGPHVLVAVGGLPEGITEAQFIEVLEAVDAGAPPPEGAFEAGAVFSKPGQDHQKLFDLTSPGQYGYFCPIRTPTGVPHYQLGFVGLFDVTAAG
jgi:hypothetical protein